METPRNGGRAMRDCLIALVITVGCVALLSGAKTASGQVPPVGKDPSDPWFQVTPYLWLASVQGENTIGSVTVPIDVNFGDIWSNLKFAFEGIFFRGG